MVFIGTLLAVAVLEMCIIPAGLEGELDILKLFKASQIDGMQY